MQIGVSESEAFSLPVVLKINVVKLIGRRWGFTALPIVLFFPTGKRNKSVKCKVYRYWGEVGKKDGQFGVADKFALHLTEFQSRHQ